MAVLSVMRTTLTVTDETIRGGGSVSDCNMKTKGVDIVLVAADTSTASIVWFQ